MSTGEGSGHLTTEFRAFLLGFLQTWASLGIREGSILRNTWVFKKLEYSCFMGFPGGASGKESVCWCGRCKRCSFDPRVRKIPWRRKWQLTPLFLSGKPNGQSSLVSTGHGATKSQTKLNNWTQHTHTHIYYTYIHTYIYTLFCIFFPIMVYHGILNIVPCVLH